MSKRVAQKQAARMVREQLARERRRRRTLWTSVAAAAVLVIAGLVGYGVYASQKPTSYQTPKHAAEDATGIVSGTGPVTVDIYLDYLCPNCRAFEEQAGSTLAKLVADNKVTVVYHPIAILDRASTTKYSTRSAASSGCAADGDKYVEYSTALFAKQPAEGSAGLSDDELIQVAGGVGLSDPAFARCVRDGKYTSWVSHVTDAASERGVSGTPTVFVNGKQTKATAADITAAVESGAK
jgi:protein-disulfide isomerase